jgi:hypothetical protein
MLNQRVQVQQIISSRYQHNLRPARWEQRLDGVDVILTTEGKEIRLMSDGGQSPPQIGWEIMITGEVSTGLYSWTLYGLGPIPQAQSGKSAQLVGH